MEPYHDHVGVATDKGFKEPGGSVCGVGSADGTTETPEAPTGGTSPAQPPITK